MKVDAIRATMVVLLVSAGAVDALSTQSPQPTAQTASDAYRQYLRSWPQGEYLNPTAVLDALSEGSPLRKSRVEALPQLAAFFLGLKNVVLGPESGPAARRTFTATGTVDGRKVRGTVTMLLENARWKIESEDWQAADPPPAPTEALRTRLLEEERAAAENHCKSNVTLGNFYDCVCYAGAVSDYRLKAGTAIGPDGAFEQSYSQLMLDKEFSPAIGKCASAERIRAYARAALPAFPDATSDCVADRLSESFVKAPFPDVDYIRELTVKAVSACRKDLTVDRFRPIGP